MRTMDSNENAARLEQGEAQEQTDVRRTKRTPRRKRLPCGATTCLHCHAQCGAVMANYILEGLEELQEK